MRLQQPARHVVVLALLALTLVLGVTLSRPISAPDGDPGGESAPVALQAGYGQRPLQFEANQGQAANPVNFLARGPGYAVFLTSAEAVLSLRSGSAPGTVQPNKGVELVGQPRPAAAHTTRALPAVPAPAVEADVRRVQLIGGTTPAGIGEAELPGRVNYLMGDDPSRWRTGVPTYSQVRYASVYPGIDLLYHGQGANLEYDFVLAPGAAPEPIALRYPGAESLELDAAGDLLIHLYGRTLRQERPLIYQESGGHREPVAGGYVLLDPASACEERGEPCTGMRLINEQDEAPSAAFWVGAYDAGRPLVIDPTLIYSTYLGGSGTESGSGIAVDGQGQAYITGATTSSDFPQATTAPKGDTDVFVTKLSADGRPLYTTYFGGSYSDQGTAIAVDRACLTNVNRRW
jgi:hypothetical protein